MASIMFPEVNSLHFGRARLPKSSKNCLSYTEVKIKTESGDLAGREDHYLLTG